MNPLSPFNLARDLWILFGLYWLIAALKRKQTKKRESWGQRLAYIVPLVLAWTLLFQRGLRRGWLEARLFPASAIADWTGLALVAAGVALAFWARWHLGTNWSGTVTLKQDHELIRTGPYRAIRHPIYTAILVALAGSMVQLGEVRGVVALAVAWLSFYVKARREESFLKQEFGEGFETHARNTGMFLPHLS
ncbi:MAG TPA: isoprenylcysteine carboxylmethyltransferase family protein [Candidatus Acidoferrales bacterium]|nr:isoprenylcysteine carboxylmethyltransferase family protein [Candidatus Acidoferrales bacterium]